MKAEPAQKEQASWLTYVLLWIPLIFIAIFNALIRESGYATYFTELRAHQISTVTGIILFGLYVWVISRKWKVRSSRQAMVIGLTWLVLTIAFEFLFGHYVVGHGWSRLLHDYNLAEGRLWVLVLIWITLAPYVMNKL